MIQSCRSPSVAGNRLRDSWSFGTTTSQVSQRSLCLRSSSASSLAHRVKIPCTTARSIAMPAGGDHLRAMRPTWFPPRSSLPVSVLTHQGQRGAGIESRNGAECLAVHRFQPANDSTTSFMVHSATLTSNRGSAISGLGAGRSSTEGARSSCRSRALARSSRPAGSKLSREPPRSPSSRLISESVSRAPRHRDIVQAARGLPNPLDRL